MNQILKVFVLLLSIFYTTVSYSQGYLDAMKHQTFEEITSRLDAYYDGLTEEELKNEKSDFKAYLHWKKEYGPLLRNGKMLEDYWNESQKTNDSYRTLGSPVDPTYWVELGPTETTGGSFVDGSNGGTANGVGPVEFVKFKPGNPNEMLAGAMMGGLFYSNDAGENWVMAGTDETGPVIGASSAVMHQQSGTWFYSTSMGSGSHLPGFLGYDGGIYRTMDYGATYQLIANQSDLGGIWTKVYKVISHPISFNEMLVATSNGVYKVSNIIASNPSHISINKVFSVSGDAMVYDMAYNANNPNIVYATYKENNDWQVMSSGNGGNNWSDIANQPAFPLCNSAKDHKGNDVNHMTLATTTANANLVYLLVDNGQGWNSEIWTMDFTSGNPSWLQFSSGEYVVFGRGKGFGVSQHVSNDVYLSRGDRYVSYRNGVKNTFWSNRYQYHVDIERLVTHPTNNGEVWMACHGGLYKSTDFGNNWIEKNSGLSVAQIWDISTSPTDPGYISVGANHNGSSYTSGSYVENGWDAQWRHIAGGDGINTQIHPTDPSRLYVSSQTSTMFLKDYGDTYGGYLTNGDWGKQELILDNYQGDVIYHTGDGAQSNVLRTTEAFENGSNTNTYPISDFSNLFSKYFVTKILSSDTRKGYLYAAVIDETTWEWYIMINNDCLNPNPYDVQSAWTVHKIPGTNWVQGLAVDPHDPMKVIVARSTNDFTGEQNNQAHNIILELNANLSYPNNTLDLTFNLPNVVVGGDCLVYERFSKQGCYLGTSQGVFYINAQRMATGDYWGKLGLGLPRATITGLEIDHVSNKLRVGLNGRGVWEHRLACPEYAYSIESTNYPQNTYVETYDYIQSTATIGSWKQVKYRAGDYIDLKPGFISDGYSDFHAFIHGCSSAGSPYRDNSMSSTLGNVVESDITDTERSDEILDFEISPNPSNGVVRVKYSEFKIVDLKVYDVSGKLIKQMRNIPNGQILNLSNVEEGVYFVQVLDEASNLSQSKLIITY